MRPRSRCMRWRTASTTCGATSSSTAASRSSRPDEGTDVYKKLGAQGRELDALLERLAIRLGREHPAVAAFKDADDAVLAISRAAGLLRLGPEADGHEAAARQIHRLNDEKRTEVERRRETFDSARERFLDAAQQAAGSHL